MDMFIAVHHASGSFVGNAIVAATQLRCHPPWVMGPAFPATHAYVAWLHGPGDGYRLDAQPPVALPEIWHGPGSKHAHKSAYWKVDPAKMDVPAMHRRAVKLIGSLYDIGELGLQLLPGLEILPLLKDAVICTNLTCEVVEAGGKLGEEWVNHLSTRIPEALAQHMDQHAFNWAMRYV